MHVGRSKNCTLLTAATLSSWLHLFVALHPLAFALAVIYRLHRDFSLFFGCLLEYIWAKTIALIWTTIVKLLLLLLLLLKIACILVLILDL